MRAQDTPGSGRLKGIAWMIVSTLLLSSMHTTVQFMSTDMHPLQLAFFRLLFALLVVLPFFWRHGMAPLKTKKLGLLTLRGVLNVCAMFCFFSALGMAPLPDVTALSFTAPLFATALAFLLLKERMGWRRLAAILTGFAGTLIVLRPGFQEISLGYFLVLGATVFWGTCVIIIRELGKTESSVTITTYMSLVMAPIALIPAIFVWQWPTGTQLIGLVALGLLGGGGQMAMTQALRHTETYVSMPFDYLRLIWVSISGYVLFADVPDLYVWIGGTVIFASTAFITMRERRKVEPPAPRT